MTDTKISELTELTQEPASDDSFPLVDASAGATKRLAWATLKAVFLTHALATAANDFLVATGAGVFTKKTLSETLTLLGKASASGLASLNASAKVVEDPASAVTSAAAAKIPLSGADKRIDPAWMSETVEIVLLDNETALALEDGVADFYFIVPERWNGWDLTAAHAATPGTASTSGTPTLQIHNLRASADMLTTRITIDAGEFTSYTAAAAPVIDTSADDLATGDRLRFDCDAAGTATKGLVLILTAAKP